MRIQKFIFAAAVAFSAVSGVQADNMQKPGPSAVAVARISGDFPIADLQNPAWNRAVEMRVDRYWSGKKAPAGRQFAVRLLWSERNLYVRFEANQTEPLVVAANPIRDLKTLGLWDRDVCEIFLAPNAAEPRKYFEFEAAPTGEWVDLFIDYTTKTRQMDAAYASGMTAAADAARPGKVVIGVAIPFAALGKTPAAGDAWLGNLFRCVGSEPSRGYLAYSPTETAVPNFHLPEKFVRFVFKN